MSHNDLKYHIGHPSTSQKQLTPNISNNSDDKKLLLVILFGWFGCQDKNLSKYSSIYEDRGCITLRYTAPLKYFLYKRLDLPTVAKKFLDILREKSLDEHPIIFHIFSTNGSLFYQNISLEMQKQNTTLQIKGIIFDSAPGRWRVIPFARGVATVIDGPYWFAFPAAILVTSILTVLGLCRSFVKGLIQWKKPQTELIILDDEPYNWPQLFIYSKDDTIINYKDIEKFVRHREAKGIRVTRLCFGNSPHVQHFIKHREVYINTVVNFISTCLDRNNVTSGLQCRL